LHGGRSVAGDGEELRGTRGLDPFIAAAEAHLVRLNFDGLVDIGLAGIFAFDVESFGREVGSGPERGGERDGGAAVGKFEIHFYRERIALASDCIGFFADGLFEFVQNEFALLDGRGSCLRGRSLRCGRFLRGGGDREQQECQSKRGRQPAGSQISSGDKFHAKPPNRKRRISVARVVRKARKQEAG